MQHPVGPESPGECQNLTLHIGEAAETQNSGVLPKAIGQGVVGTEPLRPRAAALEKDSRGFARSGVAFQPAGLFCFKLYM